MKNLKRYFNISTMLIFFLCIFIIKLDTQAADENYKARALLLHSDTSNYASTHSSNLGDVPKYDAINIRRVLELAYGDSITVTQEYAAHKGISATAVTNKAELKAAVQNAFGEAKDEDKNYFYYSGHGSASGLAMGVTVTASDLANAFEDIKGTNILIIDCCYSGGLAIGRTMSVMTEEMFLDNFVAEFESAIAKTEKGAARSRSALTNHRFKLLLSSSKEELSWQGETGCFSGSLVSGCGINLEMFDQATGYELVAALADFNQDTKISFNELYRYIQNVNLASHVRMYPQDDNTTFIKIAESKVSPVTFYKAEVEAGNQIRVFYQANQPKPITYRTYKGDSWGLSALMTTIGDAGYANYNDSHLKRLEATSNSEIVSAGSGSFVITVPDNVKTNAGSYAVVLKVGGIDSDVEPKYILPFYIAASTSQLPSTFDLTVGLGEAGTYIPADKELEIKVDFGTVNTEVANRPALTCEILDKEGTPIRRLGINEWLEVIEKGGSGTYNCYKEFYWNGKDDNGVVVPSGEYTIRVTSTGAVEYQAEQVITVNTGLGNIGQSTAEIAPTYGDTVDSNAEILVKGALTVEVIRKTGENEQIVKTLYTNPETEAGNKTYTWNGTDEVDEIVAFDRNYYIRWEFTPKSGQYTVIGETKAIDVVAHKWLAGIVTQEPTYTTEGSKTYTCQGCGETKTEQIPKLDKPQKTEPQKPTPPKPKPVQSPQPPAAKQVMATACTVRVGTKKVKTVTLGRKEKLQLLVTVQPSNATDKRVTYRTSNKKVATVSASGKITAKKAGVAKITATTTNGKKATVTVRVKKAPKKISLQTKQKTLKVGKKYRLKSKLSSGAASYQISYRSNKKSVARVSADGRITALKRGRAVITVKTYNGKRAKIVIIVKK